MFKLDQDFYDAYFKYYGKLSPFEVIAEVNKHMAERQGFTVINAINVAKTTATIGGTYLDFYMEMAKRSSFRREDINLDMYIFDIAFLYMHQTDSKALESFLDVRFTIRDMYAEIAQQSYGCSDEASIEKIKRITTEHAGDIQLPNPTSRDRWFYDLAVTVGTYSKCHSRKIGAVLVRDSSIISTGYNGPPRGVPTCDQRWFIDKRFYKKYGQHIGKDTKGVCPRRIIGFPSGQGLEVCPAGHAERNALINAARLGVETNNTKLYMSCGIPCTPCMVEIINAGIEEIICCKVESYDETGIYLLENSDIKVRLFDFLL